MNSGILLKCQKNDKAYGITKRGAEKSTVLTKILEIGNEAITIRTEENCAEGLPIVIVHS
jgi:hypothetical protein